jgi:leucyl/phenylalanyl-tRNA--protein transferase
MFLLSNELYFPPVNEADEEGILAIGGDLSTQRLILAYRNGIFPWYTDDEPIIWWCPNPRFVLFPDEIKISKSMRAVVKKQTYSFTINNCFNNVIKNCKTINREGQSGTWISEEVIDAYTNLHNLGYALSAETWKNNKLVGGLYGVKMGNIFFGESMFSLSPNASKVAFIQLVQHLKNEGVKLIDCQVYTNHLESLGAKMIDRNDFMRLLEQHL